MGSEGRGSEIKSKVSQHRVVVVGICSDALCHCVGVGGEGGVGICYVSGG
jgi:hypothetical protein